MDTVLSGTMRCIKFFPCHDSENLSALFGRPYSSRGSTRGFEAYGGNSIVYVVAAPRSEQKAGTSPKPNLVTEKNTSLERFPSVLGAVPSSKCELVSTISFLLVKGENHELSQIGFELTKTSQA